MLVIIREEITVFDGVLHCSATGTVLEQILFGWMCFAQPERMAALRWTDYLNSFSFNANPSAVNILVVNLTYSF